MTPAKRPCGLQPCVHAQPFLPRGKRINKATEFKTALGREISYRMDSHRRSFDFIMEDVDKETIGIETCSVVELLGFRVLCYAVFVRDAELC